MNMEKFNELIQSTKPVLVDFYAEWCGPCQIMKPRILDVAERIGDDAKVIQIDIDKEKELATRFRIQSVPTLIIFKNGKQQWRQSGVISAHALMQLLKEYQ
jgi:thioredoxin 1